MKVLVAASMALMIASAAASKVSAGRVDPAKIVDLTWTFDSSTIYWPTEEPWRHEFEHYGMTSGHYFYSSAKFAAPEHGGTHMDAPLHFSAKGRSAEQVPLAECIGPAVVIDFTKRTSRDPDASLTVNDIKAYESAWGRIPNGAIVIARSGWGRFWPDKKRYLGSDKPGEVAHLHFPGFSPAAASFLVRHREVAAIAVDTASIDRGQATDFPVHRIWLGANKPAFENLAHADKLPPAGATIFCIPTRIGQGTGGPARIFCILP